VFKRFISVSAPCLFKGMASEWPACRLWDRGYLQHKLGDTKVSVALTPDGRADATQGEWFLTPDYVSLPFPQAMELVEGSRRGHRVGYLQGQNDCLRREFAALQEDIPVDIKGMSRVMTSAPDAINLWIGTSESSTSLHKDPYENLYAVIQGRKRFTLYPPSSYLLLYPKLFKRASFVYDVKLDTFQVEESSETIEWLEANPLDPEWESKWPLLRETKPVVVDVFPGDVLYLPALWFHQVEQESLTIAVNYWYDMHFGPNFAFVRFQQLLMQEIRKNPQLYAQLMF